jgi:hypothetical protein
MASALGDVTPYMVLLVAVATLGPLQFGYHLVRDRHQPGTSIL